MLPRGYIENISDIELEIIPTKTYKWFGEKIQGKVDGIEAIKQAILKMLNTERYQNLIYSANYGIETVDLIGMPTKRVCMELKSRVMDCLLQDDRILDVVNFEHNINKTSVLLKFTVKTHYGEVKTQKEVLT